MPPESDESGLNGLELAKAGYANAQDVIKFLDTKAGVLTGLITISFGLPLLVVQWFADRSQGSIFDPSGAANHSPLLWSLAGLVTIAGAGLGALSLHNALAVLRPPMRSNRARFTLLFPQFNPAQGRGSTSRAFKRLEAGLSQHDLVKDYEVQLLQVGSILHRKMYFLRRAFFFFEAQFVAYLVGLVFSLAAVFC